MHTTNAIFFRTKKLTVFKIGQSFESSGFLSAEEDGVGNVLEGFKIGGNEDVRKLIFVLFFNFLLKNDIFAFAFV